MSASFAEKTIRFHLNGTAHEATVEAELLLAEFLRDRLGLKGTRKGCDVQICGACTVLVNGRPVSSCVTPAFEIDGKSITTIEGLARGEALHPIQQAFWDEGGFECGYCTPGMILTTHALLNENPDPTDDEIKACLGGNICRCTGYVSIIAAVKRAARLIKGNATDPPPHGRRFDGAPKVRGEPIYTADLARPGMLYARILRSPLPHAAIKEIDVTAAEKLPGVVAVLTRDDLTDINPYYGPLVKDQAILALDKVRYEGDPVAAVAATSEAIASEALALIRVSYEEFPAVLSIDEALADTAPKLHDSTAEHGERFPGYPEVDEEARKHRNVSFHFGWSKGDVEKGFADSHRVFEHTFSFSKVAHCSLEPQLTLAEWRDDGLTIWSSTQHPFLVRQEVAEMFGIAKDRVRLIVPFVGGAYGNKNHTKLEPLAAALSRKAGRPVFIALNAEDTFRTVSKPAMRIRIRTGVSRDGYLIARRSVIHVDSGAYSDAGPRVTQKAAYRVHGPYRIPHIQSDGYTVYTNTVPAGAFRGMGTPQVVWAYESQMDMIAREMGWDPVEFRLKNLVENGDEFVPGDTPVDCDMKAGLRRLAEEIGWGKPLEPDCGIGVSCALKDGGGNYKISEARIEIDADGGVTLFSGTVEIGQGSSTALRKIAAHELGIAPEQIELAPLDTATTPLDFGTYASSGTTVMGLAVQRAARAVKARILAGAAGLTGLALADLKMKDGVVRAGEIAVPLRDIVRHLEGGSGKLIGEGRYESVRDPGILMGARAPFWEVSWGAAKIRVDRDTGGIKILKFVTIADVGKAINPQQCHSQEIGAMMQGIGQALFEETLYENGTMLNPGFINYRVPQVEDLPDEVAAVLIENGNGPGPQGAKGMGESGLLTVPSAIANALHDAIGVRLTELPLTPEKVWRAIGRS
ncbi:MAG TPA: molybdopterin cofactor-binding domain-containing protein [candidate division Zixibacteria bacterium]|nr:molybdopterin cofactor-binding domain-containing protein [candidate division Zixibacteria bacterium]